MRILRILNQNTMLRNITRLCSLLRKGCARTLTSRATDNGVQKYGFYVPPKEINGIECMIRNRIPIGIVPPPPAIVDKPIRIQIVKVPINSYEDPESKIAPIIEPGIVEEKQAARLIVIRRRKMKRHRLRKLRVRMKFEWAKTRQRREWKKEKDFQAELMSHVNLAHKFVPANYVQEKLQQKNEEIRLPQYWHGFRIPDEVVQKRIKDIADRKADKELRAERRKNVSFKVSDYDV